MPPSGKQEQHHMLFDIEPAPQFTVAPDKLERQVAARLADRYIELLSPVCTSIAVAGSIRRLKPLVKDIEIVAIEKYPGSCFNVLSTYRSLSKTAPVNFWKRRGPRYLSFMDFSPFPTSCGERGRGIEVCSVDLFLSQPEYHGYTLFVRTGSSEWNKAAFYHLNQLGYTVHDNAIWQGNVPIYCETEEQVFNLLKIPFVEPHLRTDGDAFKKYLVLSGQLSPNPNFRIP